MSAVVKNLKERERVKRKREALDKLQELIHQSNRRGTVGIRKKWTENEILRNTYELIKNLECEIRAKGLDNPLQPMIGSSSINMNEGL